MKKINTLLIVIIIVLLSTTIFCGVKYHNAKEECENLQGEAYAIEDSISELEGLLDDYASDFAYTTKSGRKYHKSTCYYIQDRALYVNYIKALKRDGYTECSYCYSDNFKWIEDVEEETKITDVMVSVDSSVFDGVRYCDGMLQLLFDSGAVYIYYDVPQKVYNDFLDSSSLGSFYNDYIKGQYESERVQK